MDIIEEAVGERIIVTGAPAVEEGDARIGRPGDGRQFLWPYHSPKDDLFFQTELSDQRFGSAHEVSIAANEQGRGYFPHSRDQGLEAAAFVYCPLVKEEAAGGKRSGRRRAGDGIRRGRIAGDHG